MSQEEDEMPIVQDAEPLAVGAAANSTKSARLDHSINDSGSNKQFDQTEDAEDADDVSERSNYSDADDMDYIELSVRMKWTFQRPKNPLDEDDLILEAEQHHHRPQVPSEGQYLFVCCDGTWNNAIGTTRPVTNVARLARCLKNHTKENTSQLVYYSSGVGTTATMLGNMWQGAFGKGLAGNILNAYYFLCQNYSFKPAFKRKHAKSEKEKDLYPLDQIILIGFSRGGFTVRCLAALIDKVGLLRRRGLVFLNTLFNMWREQNTPTKAKKLDELVKDLENKDFLYKPKIKILAEWDTVSAMGMPLNPFSSARRRFSFVKDTVPECVEHAFHAVALNERRWSFAPMPYTHKSKNTELRQCAFIGCHSDIGGGNEDAGLSTLSFFWMIGCIKSVSSTNFDSTVMLGYFVPLAIDMQSGFFAGLIRGVASLLLWKKPEAVKGKYISGSQSKGILHNSHQGWWVLVKVFTLGLLQRPRGSCWDNIKPDCPLRIHWSVRMLESRFNKKLGSMPGYDNHPNYQVDGSAVDDVQNLPLQRSQHHWRKQNSWTLNKLLRISTPANKGQRIFLELEPSAKELRLYQDWLQELAIFEAQRLPGDEEVQGAADEDDADDDTEEYDDDIADDKAWQKRKEKDQRWRDVIQKLDIAPTEGNAAPNVIGQAPTMLEWARENMGDIEKLYFDG